MRATKLKKVDLGNGVFAHVGMAAYQGVADGDCFVVMAANAAALQRVINKSGWDGLTDPRKWKKAAICRPESVIGMPRGNATGSAS